MRYLVGILLLLFTSLTTQAQVVSDYAVRITATVQIEPPLITLSWISDNKASGYQVYRKAKSASSWGTPIASLSANTIQYADTTVELGTEYEYRIQKLAQGYTGHGYILSGIEVPAVESRGKVVLIVDSTHKDSLKDELAQFEMDLIGDGWAVVRRDVSPLDTVTTIKAIAVTEYFTDPNNVKAILLFGDIAVPYSGIINPDGHSDHVGAWAADVYYGEMDGNWTDVSINNTSAFRPENKNIPGDGKFDQSAIPSTVEVAVGRVDLSNMNEFPQSETTLLRKYLVKNHKFRFKEINPARRALIDDNFGVLGTEAIAAVAWRGFTPMFGDGKINAVGDYMTNLPAQSHLWSYGCGGGTYTSAIGIGNTTDFTQKEIKSVFTVLFGSYFGDWDYPNNLLRAPLGSGDVLVNFWAGRPNWAFHQMALGETIGYCTTISQNNVNTYSTGNPRSIHVALMGDPTLRMHIVGPADSLLAVETINAADLTWVASTDTNVIGYYIYRSDKETGPYTRIDSVGDTVYTDSNPINGDNYYMIRALALEESPSGTYYNLSQGVFDSARVIVGIEQLEAKHININIYPNPTKGNITIEAPNMHPATITLFDITGRVVLNMETNTQRRTVNLGKLPKGIYLLKYATTEGSIQKKVVLE